MGDDRLVPHESLARLTLAALWLPIGDRDGLALTTAAAEALVAGFDSPHLRELAGLHRRTDFGELRETAIAAFDELELEFPDPRTVKGQLLVLRQLCLSYRAGELSARGLTRWAVSEIGYLGAEEALELVDLDDLLDEIEHGASWAGTLDDAHRLIDEAVGRFLAT